MKVWIVENTGDAELNPGHWVDSVWLTAKEGKARLAQVEKDNGNGWCSPSCRVLETGKIWKRAQ